MVLLFEILLHKLVNSNFTDLFKSIIGNIARI